MRILTIDNPEDKVILESRSHEVDMGTLLDLETEATIEEMFKISEQPHVAGIAAPQLGDLQRIIVVKLRHNNMIPVLMINPQVRKKSKNTTADVEGCLSIPNRKFQVERPFSVSIEFDDQNSQGNILHLSGFDAKCVCHEIDHLDGILISKIGVPVE